MPAGTYVEMCVEKIVGAEMTGVTGVVAVCPPMPPVSFVVPALHRQRVEEEVRPGLIYFTPAGSAAPRGGIESAPVRINSTERIRGENHRNG